jgi:hypothetical protein
MTGAVYAFEQASAPADGEMTRWMTRSLQVLISFVIVTYSQVRKGHALCRTLAPAKPPGNQIRLPVSLRTSLAAFKVASRTAFIQTCPSVPCLEARPAKSTPLVSQCRLDRTPPVDGHLFDREPYGVREGKGESTRP